MKTLSENYSAAHGNSNETFADLIFCALVVLVLFVLALAVEVSQRVRADIATIPETRETREIKAEEVAVMTPEEIEDLSVQIRHQRNEINLLQTKLKKNNSRIESQLSALAGEQRFTGAREPAAINVAYNYISGKYYFIPSKILKHADTQTSGESFLEFSARKTTEFVNIALRARKSRGYSAGEIAAIYNAFSQYDEVIESGSDYRVKKGQVGVLYYVHLCKYIAGEVDSEIDREPEVVNAILKFHKNPGIKRDGMYPQVVCKVDLAKRTIAIADVELSPNDFRVLLISFTGRGLVLDFVGYDGKVPNWLYDQVLMPAGYISKTPKLPKL